MRISLAKFYTPQFNAHSYKLKPKTCDLRIQTDNNPNLGENPYLVYEKDEWGVCGRCTCSTKY